MYNFKLLNIFKKILISYLHQKSQKKYNKKQLDNDVETFFRLIKLRADFKDINPKSNTDQENLPLQIKNKNGDLRTPTTA